ncbi:hypothetical protein NDU88_006715 [Pleurodeles waltl]|uniref:Uncharacterized protein n=1 Tax=Pleurodeles waltl TaxID=8319 RepID=A0AAV7X4U5_PLEWA|nr:hypothetical protein NDU88_006715 [Pleurodeles waltl]
MSAGCSRLVPCTGRGSRGEGRRSRVPARLSSRKRRSPICYPEARGTAAQVPGPAQQECQQREARAAGGGGRESGGERFFLRVQERRGKGAVEAGAPSACPHQREAHEAHVMPVVESQFIQEGGTPKPPGPLRGQAVDQQDRNPVGLLVGPGPGIQR